MGAWEDLVEYCACDWKDHGGWFFECWKIEPCCGSPANLGDALYCVVCFTFCAPCSCSKLYASSVDQQCALVNHCLPWSCAPCMLCFMRHNFRTRWSIGPQDVHGWVGDIFFGWLVPWFMGCQILRGSEPNAYDWCGQFSETGVLCCVDPCKPLYDMEGIMKMPEKDVAGVVKDLGNTANDVKRNLGSNS